MRGELSLIGGSAGSAVVVTARSSFGCLCVLVVSEFGFLHRAFKGLLRKSPRAITLNLNF